MKNVPHLPLLSFKQVINIHWRLFGLLVSSVSLALFIGCSPSSSTSSPPTVFSPSEDITLTVGGVEDVNVTIEVTTNDPSADPLITISGLVNPLGTSSTVITLTITPIEGVFTTTTPSLTIPDPAGATGTTTALTESLQITNTETGAEITYAISVVFTSLPAGDVLKTSDINDYLMVMLAGETGVSEVAGSVITVRGLFNPRGSTEQSGMLTLMNDVLETEGYIGQLSSPTFTDPDGTAELSVSGGTLTLAEGTDVATPVAGNATTYTIEVMLAEYISALVKADITATFGSVRADLAAITLTGQDVTITFTNELDVSPPTMGSIMIADEIIPAVYTTVPSEFTFTDPTGIGAATINDDTFILTENGQDTPYTITINFLPRIQVSLMSVGLANAVTLELGATSVDLTVMRCELFVPTLAVIVGGETSTDYEAMFTPNIPSSYYDDTTAANNINAATITVQDGSGTAVGTAAAVTLTIQECITSALTGMGTEATPWEIDNDLRLNLVSTLVNGADRQYADDYYEVTATIDLGRANAPWSEAAALAGFTPIGIDTAHQFTGMFDCKDNVLTNLYISNEGAAGDNEGLFGRISGATIMNCRLEGVKVTGRTNVGGLIGESSDATVSSSYVTGAVVGERKVGGLVGDFVRGAISNSYTTTTVTGSGSISQAGGLVGRFVGQNNSVSSSITSSYATGDVMGRDQIGGLVGFSRTFAQISNSYATGAVSTTNEVGNRIVGGLVGWLELDEPAIYNSYAIGSVTSLQASINIGGLIGRRAPEHHRITASYWNRTTSGQMTSPGGTGKTTAELQVGAPIPAMIIDPTDPDMMRMIPNPAADDPTSTAVDTDNAVFDGWDTETVTKMDEMGNPITDEMGDPIAIPVWNFTAGQYPRLIHVVCADRQYNPEAACTSTLAP